MASSQFSHRFRQFRNNHLKPPACIRMRGRRSHDKVLWSTVSYLRSTFTATVSADIFVRVEPGAVMSKFSVGLVNLKASSTAYKNIEPEEESLLMMANPAPPSCRVPVAPRISSLFADICAGKVQTLSAGSIHGDSGTPWQGFCRLWALSWRRGRKARWRWSRHAWMRSIHVQKTIDGLVSCWHDVWVFVNLMSQVQHVLEPIDLSMLKTHLHLRVDTCCFEHLQHCNAHRHDADVNTRLHLV